MRTRAFIVLCVFLSFACLISGCSEAGAYLSEGAFMQALTKLTGDNFGTLTGVTIGEDSNGYTITEYRINDVIVLDNHADPATGELSSAELVLNDGRNEAVNEQFFSYFLVYILKAHDSDFSLEVINEIYEGLSVKDLDTPTERKISYKSIVFTLTVEESGKAVFNAKYY